MEERKSEGLKQLTDNVLNSKMDYPFLLDNEVEIAQAVLKAVEGLTVERAINLLQICIKTVPYVARL